MECTALVTIMRVISLCTYARTYTHTHIHTQTHTHIHIYIEQKFILSVIVIAIISMVFYIFKKRMYKFLDHKVLPCIVDILHYL